MEETKTNKGVKWQIIIPIIVAIIIVGIFLYLDYRNKATQPKPLEEKEQVEEPYKPEPVSPSENPRRAEELNPELDYGCAGPQHLESEALKQPDSVWEINRGGETVRASLGKYKITAPARTVFDIKKLWLYFFSDSLSKRDDELYGLESSYTSKMFLVVNEHKKEIRLGGDEYMFIELDYPLGDLYPYDKQAILEFEFLIEFKCKNIKNGVCLNNEEKPLDYISDAEVISQIRLFAKGCQEFTKDMEIEAKFKY